jgi:hypothetical protein
MEIRKVLLRAVVIWFALGVPVNAEPTDLACIAKNGFTLSIAFDERTGTVLMSGLRLKASIDSNELPPVLTGHRR